MQQFKQARIQRRSSSILTAIAIVTALSLLPVSPAFASTYTVTNTNDSGAGSLRQAVADANSHVGADTINFNIAGCGGVCTIQLASTITLFIVGVSATVPMMSAATRTSSPSRMARPRSWR